MGKIIIIINGVACSGKDLFCDLFTKIHPGAVKRISTVDIVKEIAMLCGWDGINKSDKDRKFMSDLKYLTSEYSNAPFRHAKCQIQDAGKDTVVFVMCREPSEIQKFKDRYLDRAVTLLIRRNVAEQSIPDNEADRGVFDYKYDHTVFNNDTKEELEISVKQFINIFL